MKTVHTDLDYQSPIFQLKTSDKSKKFQMQKFPCYFNRPRGVEW